MSFGEVAMAGETVKVICDDDDEDHLCQFREYGSEHRSGTYTTHRRHSRTREERGVCCLLLSSTGKRPSASWTPTDAAVTKHVASAEVDAGRRENRCRMDVPHVRAPYPRSAARC